MKRLSRLVVDLTVLAIVLFVAPAAAQDWTPIALGVTDDIHEFVSGGFSDKWLSGDGGLVATAVDLQSWTIVNSGTSGDLTSIVRWTSNGFLYGAGAGVVRRTSDTGATFVGANIPDASQSYSLYSRSGGWANAVGDGGDIYQTRDAGDSWVSVYGGATPLHDGAGFISSRSWAVGDGGLVLITNDAGSTWMCSRPGSPTTSTRSLKTGARCLPRARTERSSAPTTSASRGPDS